MSDHFHLVTFHGGEADGREMHVPGLTLADTLWVKTFTASLALYTAARAGAEEYRRRDGDEGTEYEAVPA